MGRLHRALAEYGLHFREEVVGGIGSVHGKAEVSLEAMPVPPYAESAYGHAEWTVRLTDRQTCPGWCADVPRTHGSGGRAW